MEGLSMAVDVLREIMWVSKLRLIWFGLMRRMEENRMTRRIVNGSGWGKGHEEDGHLVSEKMWKGVEFIER